MAFELPVHQRKKPVTYGKKSTPASVRKHSALFDPSPEKTSGQKSVPRSPRTIKQDVIQSPISTLKSPKKLISPKRPSQSERRKSEVDKDVFDLPTSDEEHNLLKDRAKAVTKTFAKRVLFDDRPETKQSKNLVQRSTSLAQDDLHRTVVSEPNLTKANESLQFSSLLLPESDGKARPPDPSRKTSRQTTPLTARERLQQRHGGSSARNTPATKSRSVMEDSPIIPSKISGIETPVKLSLPSSSPSTSQRAPSTDLRKRTQVTTTLFKDLGTLQGKPGSDLMNLSQPTLAPSPNIFSNLTQPSQSPLDVLATSERQTNSTTQATPSPKKTSKTATAEKPFSTPMARPGLLTESSELTPKQSKLWTDLLGDDSDHEANVAVTSTKLKRKPQRTGIENQQQSQVSNKRRRIVDMLKSTHVSTATLTSSDDDDDEDEDTMSVNCVVDSAHHASDHGIDSSAKAATQSQTQHSQISTAGSRLTYTQQRSHIAEENLQDMMLGLPSAGDDVMTPRKANAAGLSRKKTSEFDMDLSDEEGISQRPRPIHELRAAGRAARFTAQIEDLLADIADHRKSARVKRASALITLTNQLLQFGFKQHFLSHGFDHRLFKNYTCRGETIADCLVVALSITILEDDLTPSSISAIAEKLSQLSELLDQKQDLALNKNVSKDAVDTLRRIVEKGIPERKATSCHPRLLYLKSLDLLGGRIHLAETASSLAKLQDMTSIVQSPAFTQRDASSSNSDDDLDGSLTVSYLESISSRAQISSWPTDIVQAIARLPARFGHDWHASRRTMFLGYRLCLNVTNDANASLSAFAQNGSIEHLFDRVRHGFEIMDDDSTSQMLEESQDTSKEDKIPESDLLVLAIGILINLSEYSKEARTAMADASVAPQLSSLVKTFRQQHDKALQASSEIESVQNVAFGYLSILLANICQDSEPRASIAAQLPGKKLDILVNTVQEFVLHHQKVDKQNFDGAEGQEVWNVFTERLKIVFDRLQKSVA